MSALMMAICLLSPAGADDDAISDWSYPGADRGSSGTTRHGDAVLGAHYCKDVTDDFGTVLDWYAKRAGMPSVSNDYRDFVNRPEGAPDDAFGNLSAVKAEGDAPTLSTIVYAFTPAHQHVTLMLAPNAEQARVVISIAGSPDKTTIQVVGAFR